MATGKNKKTENPRCSYVTKKHHSNRSFNGPKYAEEGQLANHEMTDDASLYAAGTGRAMLT